MVSIIPAERTPWDVISKAIGQNISQNLPGAVQQGYQRQLGLNALDQAEKSIAESGGDPYKMALAFARAGAQNPALERSLGPLMQTAMANAKVGRAFPDIPQAQQAPQIPGVQPAAQGMEAPQQQEPYIGAPKGQPSAFATPSPFNIMTPDDIQRESERYAQAVQDPNAAAMRQQQLQNKNEIATAQRQDLENAALKSDVSASELPRFMIVGSKFDPRNPSEWLQNTKRAYQKVKDNDKKIERTFIPGLGQGLLGRDREGALKKLVRTSQDQKALGLEQDTRDYYADQYMSPTEIEEQFNPLTPEKEKAIKSFPRGLFPHDLGEMTFERGFPERKPASTISYEEALEKAPQEIEKMQNMLSDFFLKNVDDNTSLLVLREKLWKDRDYDWRQIGPAIREAEEKGLKLNQRQSTEMADIETQPPMQSLPDIFRDLSRIIPYLRGNK